MISETGTGARLPANTDIMADTKTANISKLVIKQAGRAKEKVNSTPHIELGHVPRAPVILRDPLRTR